MSTMQEFLNQQVRACAVYTRAESVKCYHRWKKHTPRIRVPGRYRASIAVDKIGHEGGPTFTVVLDRMKLPNRGKGPQYRFDVTDLMVDTVKALRKRGVRL